MRKTEIIASIIGLLLSFGTYWGTLYFPKFPTRLAGPEFFPRLLAILLAILCLALLFEALRKRKRSPVGSTEEAKGAKQTFFWKVVLAMGVSILYFLGMRVFGFLICTFSYFAFLMLLMQSKKKILKTILWSAATTAVTYVTFGMVLRATLPMGSIFR